MKLLILKNNREQTCLAFWKRRSISLIFWRRPDSQQSIQIYIYPESFRIFFRQKLLLIKEKFQTHKTLKFEKCHISFFFLQRDFLFQEIDTVKEWLRQALLIKKATTILSSTYMYTFSQLSLEENKKIVYIIILTNVWKTKGWLGTAGRRINTNWRPSFKRSMTIFTWRFDGLFTWRCSSIQTAY